MRDRRFKRPPVVAPAKTPSKTTHVQFAANLRPGPPATLPGSMHNVAEELPPHPESGPPTAARGDSAVRRTARSSKKR